MSLKALAKEIYLLTRHQVWQGGFGKILFPFPSAREQPRYFWVVSPGAELDGSTFQVALFKSADTNRYHTVLVFVDGQLKHPGGVYTTHEPLFWRDWDWQILDEMSGHPTRINSRESFLKKARAKRKGGGVTVSAEPLVCTLCKQALGEIEEELAINQEVSQSG